MSPVCISGLRRAVALIALAGFGFGASLLGRPGSAAGNTYYVAPGGSDANAGSQAAPFRQIRKALQVAGAGDTILVADGDYLGFTLYDRQATAAAPLTIKAVGTSARVLPTTDRGDNRDNIMLGNCAYIVIDGLRTFNAPRGGCRLSLSHHVTVKNGVFGDNGTWGIFTDFSDDVLLENNDCYGSVREHGIYFSNSGDRPIARGNRSYNNAGCGIHTNGDLSSGGDGIISGMLYENNVCWGNGANGGAGINMDGPQNGIIRNNLLFGNKAGGITCYRIDGAQGPKGMQILNNTVDMPPTARWCVLMTGTTGLNTIRNNILIHRGIRGGINFGSWTDVGNTDSDYNLMDKVTPDDGGTFISLGDWKGQGYEAHSVAPGAAAASLFVNVVTADYHLPAGSLALDKGQSLGAVPTDRDGVSRPQGAAYDAGCYERVVGGGDTTPPGAPAGLTAQAGDAQAALTWSANTEPDLAGYHVYRSTSQAGPYAKQNGSALAAAALTQTGLANGTTYWYRVSAIDTTGNESAQSGAVSATPQAPTFTISGTVTSGGSGLLGVTVSTGGATTVTDAGGNYTFAGLIGGTYTVSASKPGYTLSGAQTVTVGPNKSGVNFTAAQKTYSISGKVTLNSTGLGGVSVTGGGKSAITAADGTYTLSGLTAGTQTVAVSKSEYDFSPAQQSVAVGPSKSGINFAGAQRTYSISGKVTLNGAGLPEVSVSGGGKSATTVGDGTYTLTGLVAGTHSVSASKSGYTLNSAQNVAVGPNKTGINFTATEDPVPTFSISGAVTANGAGLAGVIVAGAGQSVSTAADGSYTLPDLPAGTHTVTVSKSEYDFQPAQQSITVGPNKNGVNFTGTQRVYTISGKVTVNGAALSGASVIAGGQNASTAADGTYMLGSLVAGTYTVSAVKSGFTLSSAQLVSVGPSRSGINFTAAAVPPPTFSISGTVRLGSEPLAGVTVSAGGVSATTGDGGGYTLSGLLAGAYNVSASKRGYSFSPAAASVAVGPSKSGIDFTASAVSSSVALARRSLKPTSVRGGKPGVGIVKLAAPAPAGGAVVLLTSAQLANKRGQVASGVSIWMPAFVTVPAGAVKTTFTITTEQVTRSAKWRISASSGGVAKTATLTLKPR
jgi:hypothetical protein